MSERCSSRNKRGDRCGAWAVTGAAKCSLHSDPRRAAQLGSKHGCRRSVRSGNEAINLAYKSLKTSGDITELLEETINQVRQGVLGPRAANTIGFLAGVQLKALAQAQTEEGENPFSENLNAAIYRSVFNRPGYTPPEQEVFDLYPEVPQKEAEPASATLANEGEPIDDLPLASAKRAQARPSEKPEIITVEVG